MAQAKDDALTAALSMFNDGLKVQKAEERAQQAIKKAERKKQQAAAELKLAQSDSTLSPEEKSEAEAAYRTAVDEFNRIRAGEPAVETATTSESSESSESSNDEPGQPPADTEDAPGADTSADDAATANAEAPTEADA